MASARKKQDEKHLKILRELVSNPQNRQCFDCHQRGPTYVNMTIGSFVCTSCSGLLRGLTPPQRVKSISMATFSPEEIELISSKGNEYCRRIWLGLYEPGRVADARDEQGIKDFMIAKYEKKRYYLDPSMANMNGVSVPSAPPALSIPVTSSSASTSALHTAPLPANVSLPPLRPLASLVPSLTLPAISTTAQTSSSSNQNAFTPDGASSGFLVDFGSSLNTSSANTRTDAFGMPTATNNVSNSSNFANFDNNPIFDATNGVPPASTLTTSQSFPGVSRKMSSGGGNVYQQPPAEDRYAALKDLDCLMKSQQNEQVSSTNSSQPDWIQAQSASPPWSAFGTSPQPGGFLGQGFLPDSGSTASNPFTGTSSSPWSVSDSGSANPFRTGRPAQPDNSPGQFAWGSVGTNVGVNGNTVNGFHSTQPTFPSSQSLTFPTKSWNSEPVGNPFILGSSPASGSHSSNPFL